MMIVICSKYGLKNRLFAMERRNSSSLEKGSESGSSSRCNSTKEDLFPRITLYVGGGTLKQNAGQI